ncbi:SGNH/GDSL hydrolase family protein [Phytomonospora endophytica]|uniref:Lysophospholipase L1-like esterase n=1 Tax=Phytomonospora endophytica TaxID=714109 RepID=A0A841FPE9_9ACTN|nr:SGNH/GDSL hydrolase family protein [Phytomonospora endophytica]MBB6033830.1 lysophospholipase L1-like esterase [Phytomonospora endophytica]GIG64651.1 lipoprotein [Phytomonospora endophytica]
MAGRETFGGHTMRRTFLALGVAVTLLLSGCGLESAGSAETPPPGSSSLPPVDAGDPNPDAPTSIAALGDSISRGVNACATIGECVEANWATGTDPAVGSHFQRLEAAHPGQRVVSSNFAENGAKVADLPGQAELAAGGAEYVTILIGANDACDATPVGAVEFGSYVDRSLGVLTAAAPDVRVLVASIPNLYALWEAGRDNERALWVWGLDLCAQMLGDAASDEAGVEQRRQGVLSLIGEYNAALAAACANYAACRFDGGAVFGAQLGLDEVSAIDYFHPSLAGQKALAEALWKAGYDW